MQGQCDVLRLLDLYKCKNYIEHAMKYRMDRIQDDVSSTYSLNSDEISLSSIVTRGVPPRIDNSNTEAKSSSKKGPDTHGKAKPESAGHVNSREKQRHLRPTSAKGILHSKKSKGKTTKCHVSFYNRGNRDDLPNQVEQASSEPLRAYNVADENTGSDVDEGMVKGPGVDSNVGVGVFLMVDRLRAGQCFVSITCS